MYRVENETTASESIGAEEYYRLESALDTQYFTNESHALHYIWWKTPESFGTPSSHGRVGETRKDTETSARACRFAASRRRKNAPTPVRVCFSLSRSSPGRRGTV